MIKILPTEITKSGFTYRQIAREGNVAVYSQHLKGRSGTPLAYETIVIKSHDGYTIGNKCIEPSEMYPGNELFGTLGFSYSGLMKDAKKIALDKMAKIIENSKKEKITK